MKDIIEKHILEMSYFTAQSISKIENDFKLIDSGVITSIDVVNLVNFLETNFDIQVFVEEVTPDNFQTVDSIVHFVKTKINE